MPSYQPKCRCSFFGVFCMDIYLNSSTKVLRNNQYYRIGLQIHLKPFNSLPKPIVAFCVRQNGKDAVFLFRFLL